MKKIVIFIIIGVLVLAGGATFGAVFNQPENVAIRSVTDVFDEVLAREELSIVESVMDGGAISFSLNDITRLSSEEDEESDGENLWGDGGEMLSGKLYISPEELFLKEFNYYDGKTSLMGEAYVSSELIYVRENETFGDRVGIEIANLRAQLENSIFAYDSGSKYSLRRLTDMTEEEYEELLDALDMEDASKLASDTEKLITHLAERAWEVVSSNAVFESATEDVSLGGHKKTARVITVTVDIDAMKLMLEEFFTEVLAEDKRIEKFITEHETSLAKLGLYDPEQYDSFLSYYTESVEELRVSRVYELERELDMLDFDAVKVEIATPVLSSDMLKLTVDLVYEDEDTGLTEDEEIFLLDLGPDGLSDSADIRVCYGEQDVRYIVNQCDSDAYESRLYVNGRRMLHFKNNKITKKFSLVYYDEDGYGPSTVEHKILGQIDEIKNGYEVRITRSVETLMTYERDKVLETEIYKLDLWLAIVTKDEMPEAPTDYITVDEIEETDVKAWKTEIENMDIDFGY